MDKVPNGNSNNFITKKEHVLWLIEKVEYYGTVGQYAIL